MSRPQRTLQTFIAHFDLLAGVFSITIVIAFAAVYSASLQNTINPLLASISIGFLVAFLALNHKLSSQKEKQRIAGN